MKLACLNNILSIRLLSLSLIPQVLQRCSPSKDLIPYMLLDLAKPTNRSAKLAQCRSDVLAKCRRRGGDVDASRALFGGPLGGVGLVGDFRHDYVIALPNPGLTPRPAPVLLPVLPGPGKIPTCEAWSHLLDTLEAPPRIEPCAPISAADTP